MRDLANRRFINERHSPLHRTFEAKSRNDLAGREAPTAAMSDNFLGIREWRVKRQAAQSRNLIAPTASTKYYLQSRSSRPVEALWKMEKIVAHVPELERSLEGWYSPGIRVGNLVFLSGLAGKDRSTGHVLPSVEDQIRQIFEDMSAILTAHGATLSNVVKVTMYFTNRKRDWPIFDRIRRELFPVNPPCSIGVGVTEIALDAAIAIDAIAVVS